MKTLLVNRAALGLMPPKDFGTKVQHIRRYVIDSVCISMCVCVCV